MCAGVPMARLGPRPTLASSTSARRHPRHGPGCCSVPARSNDTLVKPRYRNRSDDELAELVRTYHEDEDQLLDIAEELDRRTTQGAKNLLQFITIRLDELAEQRMASGDDGSGGLDSRDSRRQARDPAAGRLRRTARRYQPAPGDAGIYEQLERMRARLLDLSAANPLLNYRFPEKSSLQVVDEVPAQVLARLLDRKTMRFAPLRNIVPARGTPGPDETQLTLAQERGATDLVMSSMRSRGPKPPDAKALLVARAHRINPSYELPSVSESDASRHRDDKLQTLLSAKDLEARLRKLHREAQLAIQETGANKLHLMFGFVEWREPNPSTSPTGGEPALLPMSSEVRFAPLVLLPVTLEREGLDDESHTFSYAVRHSGEEWSVNVTLAEKCRREFRLDIPEIDDSYEDLEAYFEKVTQALRRAPEGWRLRRFMTLGLASFGKILLWRDLDPANWPAQHDPLQNRVLRAVLDPTPFAGDANDPPTPVTEEYSVDDPPESITEVPPLITDADSSQHSVLIDVVRGQSMVVQGPPGTGKSQTITNLIGAALLRGQRVLFVAEKRAALEVVHKRLEEFGLGPFCLALHSHTSQKRPIIDDLHSRIQHRTRPWPRVDGHSAGKAIAARDELNAHARRMASPVGALQRSVFEVLWRARRLLDEFPDSIATRLRGLIVEGAHRLAPQELDRLRQLFDDLCVSASALPNADRLSDHPWYGVTRHDLTFQSEDTVHGAAIQWLNSLHALSVADSAWRLISGQAAPTAVGRALTLHKDLTPLAQCSGFGSEIPGRIRAGRLDDEVSAAIDAVRESRRTWSRVRGAWRGNKTLTPGDADLHTRALAAAARRFGRDTTLAGVEEALRTMEEAREQLRHATEARAEVLAALQVDDVAALSPSVASTERLFQVGASIEPLTDTALSLRSSATAAPGVQAILERLESEAAQLRKDETTLDARFDPLLRPERPALVDALHAIVGAPRFLPTVLSSDYRKAKKCYRIMAAGRPAPRDVMMSGLRRLLAFLDQRAAFTTNADLQRLCGSHTAGLASPLQEVRALLTWRTDMLLCVRGLSADGALLERWAWELDGVRWREAAGRLRLTPDRQRAAMAFGDELRKVARFASVPGDRFMQLDLDDLQAQLDVMMVDARGALVAAASAELGQAESIASLQAELDAVRAAWSADDRITQFAPLLASLDIECDGPSTPTELLEAALTFLHTLDEAQLTPDVVRGVLADASEARIATLVEHAKSLSALADIASRDGEAFTQATALAPARWLPGVFDLLTSSADTLYRRVQRATEAAHTLHGWVVYLRARHLVEREGFVALLTLIEEMGIAPRQYADAFECATYCTVVANVLSGAPALDHFSGDIHHVRREQFVSADREAIEATRLEIQRRQLGTAAVPGIYSGRVSDLTEEALLLHEANKQRRHIPLRQLFSRAAGAIQSLKPCVLMGPLAVAQYLEAGSFEFDIVVMDEASQMRPEDALGAIARGRQLIVVGDPRQLGPTSFFDRVLDDDDDERWRTDPELDSATDAGADGSVSQEDTSAATNDALAAAPRVWTKSILDDAESILAAAAHRFPMRLLRWHYRSRHPKLISFSNQHFYGNRLIIFPSAEREAPDLGVFFHQVADAVYSDRINHAEAEAVVRAVREHAKAHADQSLLIATLNAPQAELIAELLDEAEKDDPYLLAFRARHEETIEPLDVKNLENVQGDERDRIIVSITHGPDGDGILRQRFGPILRAGGERRLNVLFTRAKRRLDVMCSFDPSALRVTTKSPDGLKILREYLAYAKAERWAAGLLGDREPDSDFEVDVARHLEARGLTVHPQVEVHGYRVDLGVVHPDLPGRYVVGVECDGATYHSAKSARDRDRLRQQVLEGLGWTIVRIWSTDWFRDPVREANRVHAIVSGLLAQQ